ncbi:cytochrome P450 [Lipomyces oligophaga]|uniref:cytochrome P450 n=1 Tax=Lipomyces oligophaga TaxID=45792 RepID=UPI0034CFB9A5
MGVFTRSFLGLIGLSVANRYVGLVSPSVLVYAFSGFFATLFSRTLYYWLIYPFYVSPFRHLPRPEGKGHWLYGDNYKFEKKPQSSVLIQLANENPDADFCRFLAFMNGERIIPLSTNALTEVMQTQCYTFIKPPWISKTLNGILGNGVLFAEGDVHKSQRKMLMPAFSYGHIKSLVPVFLSESSRMIRVLGQRLEKADEKYNTPPGVIEINNFLSGLTLDIIYRAGLGIEFTALEHPDNELSAAYRKVFSPAGTMNQLMFVLSVFVPGFAKIPFARNRMLRDARNTINKFASDAIEKKVAEYNENKNEKVEKDIISVMVREGQGVWSTKDMQDQITTFLIAGHETTASALCITLNHLCKQQDMQDKLRNEIHSAFPSGYASITSYEDIESLSLLNDIMREALRVTPPVAGTIRQTATDTTVCNQFFPKGTLVNLVMSLVNKMSLYWGEDATEFDPSRWRDPARIANASNMSFITFLQGQRACIGRRFAELEFKCILVALVGSYKFEFSDDKEIEFRMRITYRPINGMPLRITPVEVAAW